MENIALNVEFEMEHLMAMSYAQLLVFEDQLKDAIKDLEELKEQSVLAGMDESAVKYQRHIHIASSNRQAMNEAIRLKEVAAKENFGDGRFYQN